MRTIDNIKTLHHAENIINRYSISFPIDHQWAEETKVVNDFNSFFSFLIVSKGSLQMSVNYHNVSLEAYDLLIVTPRLLVRTYGASDDFKGFFLAIDEGSYNGMMASDSAFSHLTLFYTTHQVPLLHCPKRGGDIVIGLMDQLSHLMKCAVTNVYIDKMMMLVELALMLQLINILPQNYKNPVKLSHQEEVFRNFVDLLAKNYRKHHDSKFYSDGLNITNSYLARILRNISKQSVKDFVGDLLLKDATAMLKYTDRQISQISSELGFVDNTSFSKFFKMKMGISPQEFRKKNA